MNMTKIIRGLFIRNLNVINVTSRIRHVIYFIVMNNGATSRNNGEGVGCELTSSCVSYAFSCLEMNSVRYQVFGISNSTIGDYQEVLISACNHDYQSLAQLRHSCIMSEIAIIRSCYAL